MKIYYYLFYRFYSMLRHTGDYDKGFSVVLFQTVITVICFGTLDNCFNLTTLYDDKISKFIYLTIVIIPLSINYLIFVRNDKYIKIVEMFVNEPRQYRIIGDIVTSLIIGLIFVMFVIIVIV